MLNKFLPVGETANSTIVNPLLDPLLALKPPQAQTSLWNAEQRPPGRECGHRSRLLRRHAHGRPAQVNLGQWQRQHWRRHHNGRRRSQHGRTQPGVRGHHRSARPAAGTAPAAAAEEEHIAQFAAQRRRGRGHGQSSLEEWRRRNRRSRCRRWQWNRPVRTVHGFIAHGHVGAAGATAAAQKRGFQHPKPIGGHR